VAFELVKERELRQAVDEAVVSTQIEHMPVGRDPEQRRVPHEVAVREAPRAVRGDPGGHVIGLYVDDRQYRRWALQQKLPRFTRVEREPQRIVSFDRPSPRARESIRLQRAVELEHDQRIVIACIGEQLVVDPDQSLPG
jgi:hypothetical protein